MSLFIATGTNLGDRLLNLNQAKDLLTKKYQLLAESRIYQSAAVDYTNQPDFYNQVLEFSTPLITPHECMRELLEIESLMGRSRIVPKGPRLIDLDILFWDLKKINDDQLQLPHPRLFDRSFVVLPLKELPGFQELTDHFVFPLYFANSAYPLS